MIEALTSVWSVPSILVAVFGGLATGALLLYYLHRRDPRHAGTYGVLVAGALTLVMGVFYLGQTAEAVLTGDPLWYRIVSRFGLAVMFSVAAGAGLGLRLHLASRGAL